jgi:hypothetical protein
MAEEGGGARERGVEVMMMWRWRRDCHHRSECLYLQKV